MRYVGLDVHWKQSTFCVLDQRGRKVLTRTIRGRWSEVLAEMAKVRRPFSVCFRRFCCSCFEKVLEQTKRDLAELEVF